MHIHTFIITTNTQVNYSAETAAPEFPAKTGTTKSHDLEVQSSLRIQTDYERFTADKPMRVAVNMLSFSGQVSHMVIEEYRNVSYVVLLISYYYSIGITPS